MAARNRQPTPPRAQRRRHRINAGRVAVEAQIAFFHDQFGQVASEWKEDNTRVTFADFAISEKVFATLRRDFPHDDFCSEESNPADEVQQLEAEYAWVIDPIDGTNNYATGFPVCAISLALLENGEPLYGFVYDMARGQMIEGGPGFGLKDGKRTIREIADPGTLDHAGATIGLHFPLPPEVYRALEPMLTKHRIRSIGSATLGLAYTALGQVEGSIEFKAKVWDIAAACALMAAVGREMTFIGESPFPLKTFHVRSPATPYYGGSPSFCAAAQAWLSGYT